MLLTLQSGYVRGSSTPIRGASHASDIREFFGWDKQTDFIAVDSISTYTRVADSESGVVEKSWQFTLPIKITRMHRRIRSAFSGTSLGRNGRRLKKNLLF